MQNDDQTQKEEQQSISEKCEDLKLGDFSEERRHNDLGEFIPIVSTQEYRKLLNDKTSTDEQIAKRLEYIETLCRNVIRQELENYVEKSKRKNQ